MKLSSELEVTATISIITQMQLFSTSPLSFGAKQVLLITRIRLSKFVTLLRTHFKSNQLLDQLNCIDEIPRYQFIQLKGCIFFH